MVTILDKPVPVTTPLGDGYVWYITNGGMWENDEYTVVLYNGGVIKHFTSDQVRIYHNETYSITKENSPF